MSYGVFQDRVLTSAFIVSVAVHAVALLFLPGLRLMDRMEITEWLEVDLLPPPEVTVQETAGRTPQDAEAGGENGDHLGESPLFPSPPVWIPERMNPVPEEPVAMRLTIPTDQLPDVAGPGTVSFGDILSDDDPGPGTALVPSGRQPPEIPWQPSRLPVVTPDTPVEPALQITGEVARRKVVYRPPPPRPTTQKSGTVHIKFWVLPDGTIGKMVPLMRSDPELETIAMEYLERFRFEAVDPSVGRQSGSIPIRFQIR
ncbi:MAG TPA: energy transducer TonB [bacterium]|nr:energy transducer TonB [bacterium]